MGKRFEQSAIKSRLRAKRRQASKLTEIREALVADGFDSAGKQAIALGVSRPTAWALLNRDHGAGPSAKDYETHSFVAEVAIGSKMEGQRVHRRENQRRLWAQRGSEALV